MVRRGLSSRARALQPFDLADATLIVDFSQTRYPAIIYPACLAVRTSRYLFAPGPVQFILQGHSLKAML